MKKINRYSAFDKGSEWTDAQGAKFIGKWEAIEGAAETKEEFIALCDKEGFILDDFDIELTHENCRDYYGRPIKPYAKLTGHCDVETKDTSVHEYRSVYTNSGLKHYRFDDDKKGNVTISYNAYVFDMEQDPDGEWRLMYEDKILIDYSGNEDHYGDAIDVADGFAEYLENYWEETVEPTIFSEQIAELEGALFEWGRDPIILEDEEDCLRAAKLTRKLTEVNKADVTPEEWEKMLEKLNLGGHEEVDTIYTFFNLKEGSLCYSHEWNH